MEALNNYESSSDEEMDQEEEQKIDDSFANLGASKLQISAGKSKKDPKLVLKELNELAVMFGRVDDSENEIDKFQQNQATLRTSLRVEKGREQPIDMVAKVILGLFGHITLDLSKTQHENYPGYKIREPYMILADHTIDESDIKMYI